MKRSLYPFLLLLSVALAVPMWQSHRGFSQLLAWWGPTRAHAQTPPSPDDDAGYASVSDLEAAPTPPPVPSRTAPGLQPQQRYLQPGQGATADPRTAAPANSYPATAYPASSYPAPSYSVTNPNQATAPARSPVPTTVAPANGLPAPQPSWANNRGAARLSPRLEEVAPVSPVAPVAPGQSGGSMPPRASETVLAAPTRSAAPFNAPVAPSEGAAEVVISPAQPPAASPFNSMPSRDVAPPRTVLTSPAPLSAAPFNSAPVAATPAAPAANPLASPAANSAPVATPYPATRYPSTPAPVAVKPAPVERPVSSNMLPPTDVAPTAAPNGPTMRIATTRTIERPTPAIAAPLETPAETQPAAAAMKPPLPEQVGFLPGSTKLLPGQIQPPDVEKQRRERPAGAQTAMPALASASLARQRAARNSPPPVESTSPDRISLSPAAPAVPPSDANSALDLATANYPPAKPAATSLPAQNLPERTAPANDRYSNWPTTTASAAEQPIAAAEQSYPVADSAPVSVAASYPQTSAPANYPETTPVSPAAPFERTAAVPANPFANNLAESSPAANEPAANERDSAMPVPVIVPLETQTAATNSPAATSPAPVAKPKSALVDVTSPTAALVQPTSPAAALVGDRYANQNIDTNVPAYPVAAEPVPNNYADTANDIQPAAYRNESNGPGLNNQPAPTGFAGTESSPASPQAEPPVAANGLTNTTPYRFAPTAAVPDAQTPAGVAQRPTPDTFPQPNLEAQGGLAEFTDAQVLARIDGEVILACEVVPPVMRKMESLKGQIPDWQKDKVRDQLVKQSLDMIIQRKLLYLDAKREIPEKAMPQVDNQLRDAFESRVEELVVENKLQGRHQLEEMFEAQGSSMDRQRKIFCETMLARQWMQKNSTANEMITREELLKYYYDHRSEYAIEGKAKWEELMVSFSKYSTKDEAYQAIASLGNLVMDGYEFGNLAKARSHGLTAAQGGSRDWTTKGSLVFTNIDDALFTLPVGQLSPIMETKEGFHIVRVTERKEPTFVPFPETQKEIREKILGKRHELAQNEYLKKLRSNARIWTAYDGPNDAAATASQSNSQLR